MKLSKNFSLEEFTYSDTAKALKLSNAPSPEHLKNLTRAAFVMEYVRLMLGSRPIKITSGYRGPALNKAVKGVANSDHCLGYAIDFQCPSFGTPYEVAKFLSDKLGDFDQLIHERKPNGAWWVHLSVNPRGRKQLLTYNGSDYTPGIKQVTF